MPSRLSAYAFILSGAVAFAFASGLAGAQSQMPRPGQSPAGAGPGPRGPQAAQQAAPQGQARLAPTKPYKPLAVTPPKPVADATFAAFRKELANVADRKDRAALTRLVAANFFWMSEKGDKADKRKPAIDNLAAAIDLDNKDGSGWEALAGAASDPTLAAVPVPGRQGVMCAPASPTIDEKAFTQLMKDTGTDASDWGYPAEGGLEVKAAAQANAPVIDKLGLNLVRVLSDEQPANAAPPNAPPFIKVVTPAGKTGFVSADAVSQLESDQFCYAKDAGGWKIVGFSGGE